MEKIVFALLLFFGATHALDQETTCIVLKVNEKEFAIVKDCKNPIDRFDEFMKRTNRTGKDYRILFDGTWYKLIFD